MISTTRVTAYTILWLLFTILHSHLLFRAILPLTHLFRPSPSTVGIPDYLLLIVFSLLAIPFKDSLLRRVLGVQIDDWRSVNFLALFLACGLMPIYLPISVLLFSMFRLPDALFYVSVFFVFRLALHFAQYYENPGKLPKSWFHARLFSAFLLACAVPANIAAYGTMQTDSISPLFLGVIIVAELIIIFSDIELRLERGKWKKDLYFPLKMNERHRHDLKKQGTHAPLLFLL